MRRMQAILAGSALLLSLSAAQAAEKTAIEQGQLALKRGQNAKAVELFTGELNAQNTSPEARARAFYLRAKAYVSLGEPGRARSDVMLALWLGKLSASETADAQKLKARLSGGTAQVVAAPPTSSARATPAAMSTPVTAAVTEVSAEPLRAVKVPAQQTSSFAAVPVDRVQLAPVKVPKSAGAARVPSPMPTAFAAQDSVVVTVPVAEERDTVTPSPAPVPSDPEQQATIVPKATISPWVTAAPVRAASTSYGGAAKTTTDPVAGGIVTGSVTPARYAPAAKPAPEPPRWQSQVAVAPVAPASVAPAPAPIPPSATVTAAPSAPPQRTPEPEVVSEVVPPPASSGGSLALFGGLFDSEPSPNAAAIAEADAAQRRYIEKIRRHNEALKAAMDGSGRLQ